MRVNAHVIRRQSMAFVGGQFLVTLTFRDSGNDLTNKTIQIQAADMTAALADAATIAGLYAAVSDASIDKYAVTQVFTENAPEVFTDATVRNSNQAVLTVSLASDVNKKATIVIPAPTPDVFTAATGEGSDIVDITNTDVIALIEAYQVAGEAYLSDGENVHATTPNLRGIRRTVYRRLA